MVNALVPGGSPGTTRHADGSVTTVFAVAERYAAQGILTVVIAGERYGTGSSRDWAAKAQHLLGVRAVLAASFERIHRTNLIGMGIMPLVLPADVRSELGEISATDRFEVDVEAESLDPRAVVRVRRVTGAGRVDRLGLVAAVETTTEVDLLRAGGAIPMILLRFLADAR